MRRSKIFISCYHRGAATDTGDRTPTKPRLKRFVDIYSPEHLNLTPKAVSFLLNTYLLQTKGESVT